MGTEAGESESAVRLEVPPEQSGAALLEFLSARMINVSKAALRRLIASGQVRVNGSAVPPRRRLRAGDVVSLPPGLSGAPPAPQELPIEVLHEDADHLCVNKPAGCVVLPARGGRDAAFYESLTAYLNRDAPAGGPYRRPHIVHRLDRGTTGVLLVAKHADAGRALSRQFELRQVEKTYLALIEGVLPQRRLALDIPMRRAPGSRVKMRAERGGPKPASTVLETREEFAHFCLLTVRPLTGRQHQIRVHLAAIGYPPAVDALYGRRDALTGAQLNQIVGKRVVRPDRVLLDRCPLHAASVRYAHPLSGCPMTQHAPMPSDLAGLLELLRRADRC